MLGELWGLDPATDRETGEPGGGRGWLPSLKCWVVRTHLMATHRADPEWGSGAPGPGTLPSRAIWCRLETRVTPGRALGESQLCPTATAPLPSGYSGSLV